MFREISLVLAATCLLVGCKPPAADTSRPAEKSTLAPDSRSPAAAPPAQTPPPEPQPAPPGQTEAAEKSSVRLDILDWDATLGLVRQKQGEVVVLDLWSTECPPCMAEFPQLVELHKKHSSDVACISVSVYYEGARKRPIESNAGKVLEFLRKQGATFENVLLSTDADTLFNSKIEHSSLPVVYVFDRQGKLAGQFPDPSDPAEFTYQEQVIPFVEKLLAQH